MGATPVGDSGSRGWAEVATLASGPPRCWSAGGSEGTQPDCTHLSPPPYTKVHPTSRGCEKQQPSNCYSNHKIPWDQLDPGSSSVLGNLRALALRISPIEPRLPQWPDLERHHPLLETSKMGCPTSKILRQRDGVLPFAGLEQKFSVTTVQ